MVSFDNICYKNSFLNQVIVRLDFLEFIPSETLFSERVLRVILSSFPAAGMRQMLRFNDVNVVLNDINATAKTNSQQGYQQEFMDTQKNKLKVSNKFIILDVTNYESYEKTLKLLEPVLKVILELIPVTAVRTGVRYINVIGNGVVRLTKSLFTPTVGYLVNTELSKEDNGLSCIRSMCLNEYRIKDMRLNYRYGMFNPEYPSPMRQANFVLDYDCYCDLLLSGYEQIMSHICQGHDAIQYLFESSITDNLRKVMGNG